MHLLAATLQESLASLLFLLLSADLSPQTAKFNAFLSCYLVLLGFYTTMPATFSLSIALLARNEAVISSSLREAATHLGSLRIANNSSLQHAELRRLLLPPTL